MIRSLSKTVEQPNLSEKTMNGDDIWVFPETKYQNLQWKSLSITKTEKSTNVKIMHICFSDIKGIVHYKCVHPKHSTKHSTFNFWNICSSTFIIKAKSFTGQVDFASQQ
jgi:hypothetical protein